METEKSIWNATKASDFLNIHVETIRWLARQGRIPAFKIGKDWRFQKEALLDWVQTKQSLPQSPLILVVDDDPVTNRFIKRVLEPLGYEVHGASNGEQGLKALAQNAYHLVLLDLMMPGMSGPEFLKSLRQSTVDIPIIIITGYPDSRLMMEANLYGPLILISKPIEREKLIAAVRMVLKEPQETPAMS